VPLPTLAHEAAAAVTVGVVVPLQLNDTAHLGLLADWCTNQHAQLRQRFATIIHYYLHYYNDRFAQQYAMYDTLLVQLAQSIEDCILRASSDASAYSNTTALNSRVQIVAGQFLQRLKRQSGGKKRKISDISTAAGADTGGSSGHISTAASTNTGGSSSDISTAAGTEIAGSGITQSAEELNAVYGETAGTKWLLLTHTIRSIIVQHVIASFW
jgi:hypothetical protein